MLFCGLFDLYAMRMKTYYAFAAYNELYDLQKQLSVQGEPENGLCALAAGSAPQACVLVVNIAFENLGDKKHWIAETIDETHDLEKTAEGDLSEEASLTIPLPPYGITLIRLG